MVFAKAQANIVEGVVEVSATFTNKRKDVSDNVTEGSSSEKRSKAARREATDEQKGRKAGYGAGSLHRRRKTTDELTADGKSPAYIQSYHIGYDSYQAKYPDNAKADNKKGRRAGYNIAYHYAKRKTDAELIADGKTSAYIQGYHAGYDACQANNPNPALNDKSDTEYGRRAGYNAAHRNCKRKTDEELIADSKTPEFIHSYNEAYAAYQAKYPHKAAKVTTDKEKGRETGRMAASRHFKCKSAKELTNDGKSLDYIQGYQEGYDNYQLKHVNPMSKDILSEPPIYELFHLPPQGGINAKYLGGALPELPFPLTQKSATYTHAHKIPFKNLLESTVNISAPINKSSIQTRAFEADFYTHVTKEAIAQVSWTFICAGRKEKALLPESSHVVLVLTQTEYEDVKFSCPSFVNVLVVKKLTSERYGEYDNLSLVTARRLAIFLFAQHHQLTDFLMLDDNIQSVSHMGKENSWEEFYALIQSQLGKRSFVSVQSYNPISQPLDSGLGSKLFFINMQIIREKLSEQETIFLLFPESKQASKWGEDYYFQLVLQALLHPTQTDYGLVSAEKALLLRSRKHRNRFVNSSSNGSNVIAKPFDMPLNVASESFVKEAIRALNDIIQSNLARYAAAKRRLMDANVLKAHASANGVSPTGECSTWLEIDDELDFYSQYIRLIQIIEFNPLAHRAYQLDAIKILCQAQDNRLRYQMATGSGKTRVQCELARMAYHLLNPGEFVVIVTPMIQLVKQFYDAFIALNQSNTAVNADIKIPDECIVKISSDTQSASLKLLLMNQAIRRQRGVLIFCEDSFHKLLSEDPDFLSSIPLICLDEYQLYPKSISILCCKIEKESTLVIGFTATPPEKDPICETALYTYGRERGVSEGYLTPVYAESLGVSYTKQHLHGLCKGLPHLLSESSHPGYSDKSLKSLKGLIYMSSIELCEAVKVQLANANFNSYAIHSQNSQSQKELEKFITSDEPGVIIACDMLRIGFDCPDLSWVLIGRAAKDDASHRNMIEQMIGRVMRKHRGKHIGYVLAFDDVVQTVINSLLAQQPVLPEFSSSYQQQIKVLPKKSTAYITSYIDEAFIDDVSLVEEDILWDDEGISDVDGDIEMADQMKHSFTPGYQNVVNQRGVFTFKGAEVNTQAPRCGF